jgi:Protein of unknown function (DUF993)
MADEARIMLPGRRQPLTVTRPGWAEGYPPPTSRRVYAAAHIAARRADAEIDRAATLDWDAEIDWDATLGLRDHLWAHGFGVAEAMDTAQRGMGLSWPAAQELIARSADRLAKHRAAGALTGSPAMLACGAGTDQLADGESHSLATITRAYQEQLEYVQDAGADVILMASRALAASARSARDYLDVYGELLEQAARPVILHWLGDAFDPALRGYWGGSDFGAAADTVLDLIERAGQKVDGVKLSVLDADKEVALRRRLPAGVRMYTGDDFNYAELILGDASGHSDALLGAFAAIAAPAAAALQALDSGDVAGYRAAMTPTVPLSRVIFEAPTYHYKVGVAFLAWLNGWQPEFAMVGRLERQRTTDHLVRVFELAAAAGVLSEPELAVSRMAELLVAA